LGWTQNDLAEKARLGITTVRQLETDVSHGWESTKMAIAKALNCTIDDLNQIDSGDKPTSKTLSPHDAAEIVEIVLLKTSISKNLREIVLFLISGDPAYNTELSASFVERVRSLLKAAQ
jgi:transcriptional regulator with XRE-family HTH domain